MENYREMREQKLKSVDEILHQISCMDRAVNEKQLDAVIPFILKAIGKYANADRVYIFDWVTGKRERITNTFEWAGSTGDEAGNGQQDCASDSPCSSAS